MQDNCFDKCEREHVTVWSIRGNGLPFKPIGNQMQITKGLDGDCKVCSLFLLVYFLQKCLPDYTRPALIMDLSGWWCCWTCLFRKQSQFLQKEWTLGQETRKTFAWKEYAALMKSVEKHHSFCPAEGKSLRETFSSHAPLTFSRIKLISRIILLFSLLKIYV